MPEINDVLPGEIILASYNNDVKDRSVQRYVDEAARDAAEPLPEAGELCYLTATQAFQVFNGTEWDTYYRIKGGTGEEIGPGSIAGEASLTLNSNARDESAHSLIVWVGNYRMRMISNTTNTNFQSDDEEVTGNPARPFNFTVGGTGILTLAKDLITAGVDMTVGLLKLTTAIEVPDAGNFRVQDDNGHVCFNVTAAGNTVFYNRATATPEEQARLRGNDTGYNDNTGGNSNTLREILVGTSIPDNGIGKNGDVYLRYQA